MDAIINKAIGMGFTAIGCAPASPSASQECFEGWMASGRAAGMQFLSRHAPLRRHPETLLPGARSIIMVAARYIPANTDDRFAGHALLPDYHDVLRARLHKLAEFIRTVSGANTRHRICVDSAPLPEREWAIRAGLGWRGRQGALVHSNHGCCLFLGALILDTRIAAGNHAGGSPAHAHSTVDSADACPVNHAPKMPEPLTNAEFSDHCRNCRRCVAACPNQAIGADGLLDARRCAAYWTIEHKELIPRAAAAFVGHHLFGCDICTAACPHNPMGTNSVMPEFQAAKITPPTPEECLEMDEKQFDELFTGTPVMRLGRARLQRNAVIVLHNQGQHPRAENHANLAPLARRQYSAL